MSRIIAIDFGRARVGLAVTDSLRITANALATVKASECIEYIKNYCLSNDVQTIVVGRPLQMNGEPSDCQKYITPFIGRLRAALPDKTIDFCDERFTSVLAHRAIIEAGVPKAKRRNKELVDKTAAVIILQSYLLERERKDFV